MPTAAEIARWRSLPKTPRKTATITRTSLPAYHNLYNLTYRNNLLATTTVPEYATGHAITYLHQQAKQQGFTHVKQGKHVHAL
jgi:hypothetical protein